MTAKQEILAAIKKMNDDLSFDDAIEAIYLLKKIDRALQEADAGDVMDHDEFMGQLMRENEEDAHRMDKRSARGPSKNQGTDRAQNRPGGSGKIRVAAKKINR